MFVRVLMFVLGLIVGAGCAPTTAPPIQVARGPSVSELVDKTLALVGEDEEGNVRPFCSGVWLGDAIILTAAHCVTADDEHDPADPWFYSVPADIFPGPSRAVAKHPGKHAAVLWRLDKEHDLALLKAVTRAPTHGVAALRFDDVHVGEHAYSVGHPKGLWWSYSSGDVAAIRLGTFGLDTSILWVQSTAPISPGNSGGGLFDERGELIGVCSRGLSPIKGAQGLNLFVHVRHVIELIDAAGRQ